MSNSNANNPTVIAVNMGTLSAAGDYPVVHLPKAFILKEVKLLNGVTITADNTNFVSLTLKSGSDVLGALSTEIAKEGIVTALEAKAFTAAEVTLAAGSNLSLTYAEGGTGTLTAGQIVVYGHWK